MKVTLISNFLNHHQTPFCNEMYKILGDNFKFVSTIPTPIEFLNSGYEDCSNYVYNLNSYLDENKFCECINLSFQSDVVILGEAPYIFVKKRLKYNKLTFKYSERIFKSSPFQIFDYKSIYHILNRHTRYYFKSLFLLSASAFASSDYGLFFAYPHKKIKWGYFTSVENINIENLVNNKVNQVLEIIWVARFINWKHPEMMIKLAQSLKKECKKFHITMIGKGELWQEIKEKIDQEGLKEEISLAGNISNTLVREKMKESNIFVFTSDRGEGWGAVLNEAMSSGCAVVVSKDIGSAPYLIKDRENGLLFKTKDAKDLSKKVSELFENEDYRKKIAIQAYYTMRDLWSAKNAANQFLLITEKLLNGERILPIEGPCSRA